MIQFSDRVIRLLIAVLVIFFVNNQINAEANTSSLEFGSMDFPPFSIVNDDQSLSGSKVEMIRKILNHAGIKFTEKGYPSTRLFKNLAKGTTHVWMGTKGVPSYNDYVLYSDNVVDEIEVQVYTRGDVPQPTSKEELRGLNVLALKAYAYGGLIRYLKKPENNITVNTIKSHEAAIKMLLSKRTDYLIVYRTPAEAAMKKLNVSNLKSASLLNLQLYFIVSKRAPNAIKLLKKMETSYKVLKEKGDI